MYCFVGCAARQFMTRTVITVNRQTTMRELAALFEKHDFNAFPVMEDGKLCGIISKFDFLHAFAFTTSQVVPHYSEIDEPHHSGGNDRGCSACRPGIAINASSSIDGGPQDAWLSGDERRRPIGGHDLSRRRDARPQRDNRIFALTSINCWHNPMSRDTVR